MCAKAFFCLHLMTSAWLTFFYDIVHDRLGYQALVIFQNWESPKGVCMLIHKYGQRNKNLSTFIVLLKWDTFEIKDFLCVQKFLWTKTRLVLNLKNCSWFLPNFGGKFYTQSFANPLKPGSQAYLYRYDID